MAAPTIRQRARAATTADSTSLVATWTTGAPLLGSTLILAVGAYGAVSPPSGYVVQPGWATLGDGAAPRPFYIWTKTAGSSEPTTVTLALPTTAAALIAYEIPGSAIDTAAAAPGLVYGSQTIGYPTWPLAIGPTLATTNATDLAITFVCLSANQGAIEAWGAGTDLGDTQTTTVSTNNLILGSNSQTLATTTTVSNTMSPASGFTSPAAAIVTLKPAVAPGIAWRVVQGYQG